MAGAGPAPSRGWGAAGRVGGPGNLGLRPHPHPALSQLLSRRRLTLPGTQPKGSLQSLSTSGSLRSSEVLWISPNPCVSFLQFDAFLLVVACSPGVYRRDRPQCEAGTVLKFLLPRPFRDGMRCWKAPSAQLSASRVSVNIICRAGHFAKIGVYGVVLHFVHL